jgi:uncharacterized membrane protein YhiD involved in acid resistance
MFQDFNSFFNFSISLGDVITNLLVAFICGIIIAFFYKASYKGPGYTNAFVNSLIILAMVTSIVIMVIGNNLARAFGLVGAMSIIRFRTALKDTQDIIYIFFALAVGMAAGVGLASVAFASTIIVCIVMMVLSKTNLVISVKEEYLLQFYYEGNSNKPDAPYVEVIKNFCKNYKLINIKALGNGDGLELSYYIQLIDINQNSNFVKELKNISGLNHVNLFFDEDHF